MAGRWSLADQVASWVEEHLAVELTPWQQDYLRSIYGDASPLEG